MTEKKRDARKAIEDLDLEAHLARAGAAATSFAQQAVTRTGAFAHTHRDRAHGWLDRAEKEVDRVTGGKAHGAVSRVRSGLAAGVDVIAEQRPDEEAGDDGGDPGRA